MRRLFEQARQQLEAFVEQRDDLLLLVACGPNDDGFILQALRDAEQANASDVFLFFSDNFAEPSAFVAVLVERLKNEHQIACTALAEEGREPLPPLPESLFNQQRPAPVRLVEAITFARGLLPAAGGHRLVWVMFPQQVTDWAAYYRLLSALVPWEGVLPWMGGLRLICRGSPDLAKVAPDLAKGPRVRTWSVSLGPKEMEQGLHEEVANESAPVEERMQALLSLAVMDYGHNRLDDAEAKFNHLLGHYQQTENAPMQAFVLNSLGDVAQRRGDLEKALHQYECALVPAGEAKGAVVLSMVVRNLGDLAYKQKRFADAEAYFTQLDKLTTASLDPESKARALEWRGLSQEQQKATDRAVESWETAAAFCREVWLPASLRTILEHLARTFKQQRQKEKLAAVEAELQSLPPGEKNP